MSSGLGSVDLGSAYGTIGVKFADPGSGMAGLTSKIEAGLQNIGSKFTSLGSELTRGLAPVSLFVGAGVLSFAKFDDILTEIEARTGATAEQMELVKQTALQMGQDTAFSASDAAAAMLELQTAGFSLEDTMTAIGPVLDAAAASGMSLADAAGAVTTILSQFGLEAADAAQVADTLAKAAGASRAKMSDLAASFNNVGPIASEFGLSVEETAAVLAVFSQKGIMGAEAGTQLKSMLTNMMRPTEDVQAMWESLGISMFDTEGNMRSVDDVIDDLNVAMDGMSDQERLETLNTLGGSYGQVGLSALLAEGGIDGMLGSMEKQASASEIAKKKMQSWNGVVDQLKSTMETLSINVIGPMLEKYIKPLVVQVTTLANKLSAWAQENPELAAKLGLVLGVLAILGPVLIGIGTIISLVGTAVGALGVAFGVIFSPIGILIALIVALGVAYATNFMGFRDAVNELGAVVRPVIEGIVETFGRLIAAFQEGGLSELFNQLKTEALNLGSALIPVIEAIGPQIAATLLGWAGAFVGWITNSAIPWMLEKLGNLASDVIDWIVTQGPIFATNLLTWATEFTGWIADELPMMLANLDTFINGIIGWIIGQIPTLGVQLNQFASEFFNWVLNAIPWLIVNLGIFIQNVWDWITTNGPQMLINMAIFAKNAAQWAIDALGPLAINLGRIWLTLFVWIVEKAAAVGELMKTFAKYIANWISDALPNVVTKLGELWAAIKAWADEKSAAVFAEMEYLGANILNGIQAGIEGAWESFKSFMDGIAEDIKNLVPDALQSHSPSRWMAKYVGATIPPGIAMGIDETTWMAVDAMARMSEELMGFGPSVTGALAPSNSNSSAAPLAAGGSGGGGIVVQQMTVSVPAEILRDEPRLQQNAELFGQEFMQSLRSS